jgi:hypothetical protein
MKMTTRFLALVVSVSALLGCGDSDVASSDTEFKQEFLVWNPGTTLMNEHTNWHNKTCDTTGGRRCALPGENFLEFHRAFLNKLRTEFVRQGKQADITPWYSLPPAMKLSSNGWAPQHNTFLEAIETQFNPNTSQRFQTLDEYGTYIEEKLHGALHGIAVRAFGEAEVGPVDMSPKSTYFFKIHGWVDYHFSRFQKGDFNKDGMSDIVQRNMSTGAQRLSYMYGASQTNVATIPTLAPGSCNYYLGGTADMNYDGNLDLVWHGPSCNQIRIWMMKGATRLSDVTMTAGQSSAHRLIGVADFDADTRPDIAWRNNSTNDIRFWKMNGTELVTQHDLDVPANYTPLAVADVNVDGTPDIVLGRDSSGTRSFSYLRMNTKFVTGGSVVSMGSGINKPSTVVLTGTGRFSINDYQQDASVADLMFAHGTSIYTFGVKDPSGAYVNHSGAYLEPPLVNQGPL